MMISDFSRTAGLIGDDKLNILTQKNICIFGCGGVGSYVAEAIARCAVGNITVVDNDTVDASNINRQIIAIHSTIGKFKADVEKERILDINPQCNVNCLKIFYDESTLLPLDEFDYIVDAIDSVPSKLILIERAINANVPIISSMGTGNRIDPSKFVVDDISKTSYCPLAKKMRYELKKRGIYHLNVLYSPTEPIKNSIPPCSISFVPATAGLLIASRVINDLIK